MRILVLGSTGLTGREIVRQALERGHEVTAFARVPTDLAIQDLRLKIVQGDIQRPETIRSAIPGHQAVLSALGARALRPGSLLSDAAQEIVRAMQPAGVGRVLWMSSLGVGTTRGQLGPIYNWVFIPFLLRQLFADVAHFMLEELAAGNHVRRTVGLCY